MREQPPETVATTVDPAVSVGAPVSAGQRSEYLLVIDGDRSTRVPLPASGELLIGRGPDAGLSVEDPLVSRAHARLLATPDGLRVVDLESRHGTTLNGERIAGSALVSSGDVIGLGAALLIVRRQSRVARAPCVLEQALLVRRAEDELARAARSEREVSLVIARAHERASAVELLAALAEHARPSDTTSALGPRHAAALLPEQSADDAVRIASELSRALGPRASFGVATAPFDAGDADALVAAARAACDGAAPGAVARANDVVETLEAGPQRITIADPAMARLYELARRLARSSIPILIGGETGSGKELAAAAVHAFSPRANGPFVSVNCAAIPEGLAESELFGHAKGAFSGAVAAKPGHLEIASGGTLFLDEIGELVPAIQAKLLRVLESGELLRVGEVKPRTVDLRLVAATNRDLQAEVDAGRFRSDLFFRLGAARLEIPPLRDRPRDLAILGEHFLAAARDRLVRGPLALSIGAGWALQHHDWPGNIRELRHVVEYAAAAVPDDATEIEIWHLPPALAAAARRERDAPEPGSEPARPIATAAAGPSPGRAFRPIADEVRELERARMIDALRATDGVQNRAAELIEMPLRTFVTKLKRYAIAPADWGGV